RRASGRRLSPARRISVSVLRLARALTPRRAHRLGGHLQDRLTALSLAQPLPLRALAHYTPHGQPLLDVQRDLARDLLAARHPRDLKVVLRLEVQPELGGGVEEARQAQGRVRRDGPLAEHDLAEALGRDASALRELVARHLVRLE